MEYQQLLGFTRTLLYNCSVDMEETKLPFQCVVLPCFILKMPVCFKGWRSSYSGQQAVSYDGNSNGVAFSERREMTVIAKKKVLFTAVERDESEQERRRKAEESGGV